MGRYDRLFVFCAFFLQIALIVYFAIRKYHFDLALNWGWLIYALALLALIVSVFLVSAGKAWYFWLGGFLFAVWAFFGYLVDIARPSSWRSPIYLPVFIPYVLLYLAGLMFYWWPLGLIQRPLWFVYAVLFVISTDLNVTSHGG